MWNKMSRSKFSVDEAEGCMLEPRRASAGSSKKSQQRLPFVVRISRSFAVLHREYEINYFLFQG